jgi:hypothetical protein
MNTLNLTQIPSTLEVLGKRRNNESLTTEEEIMVIKWDLHTLIEYTDVLEKRIEELEGNKTEVGTQPKKLKGVYTIREMYFVNEYEYRGKEFANFMVRLDGDDNLYAWDRILPIKNSVTAGHLIYCEIENDKLRNVKSLQNI